MTKAVKQELQNMMALALCAGVTVLGICWLFCSDSWLIGAAFIMTAWAILLRGKS